jgi:hypothetical protein
VEDSSNHRKRSGALVFVELLQQPRVGDANHIAATRTHGSPGPFSKLTSVFARNGRSKGPKVPGN